MTDTLPGWLRVENGRSLVALRLTPRGGRDAVDGALTLSDGRMVLGARVRSIPEDGAANAALCGLLARLMRLPARQVRLVSGATSRLKTIEIEATPAEIVERLGKNGA